VCLQLKHRLGITALFLGLSALGLSLPGAVSRASILAINDQTADALLQYFSDSHDVSVRSLIGNYSAALSPSSAISVQWLNEEVVVPAIEAPAGSQEAVDAITTASRPISGNANLDYTKTRNEFVGELRHRRTLLGYYISSEVDYLGQQISLRHNRDFDNQLLNLSFGASYGWDSIEPLADDDTQAIPDSKNTLHFNAVATRILSPKMLVRVGFEYNVVGGLQHNPYRNVYAGGTNVAERHPARRHRRDAFVRLNRYLGNRSSAKLGYRFYNDDWGINSHELGTELSQYVTRGLFASYRYRYYTQTAASFFSNDYLTTGGVSGFLTGDFRMAPLSSHLFGFALDVDLNGVAFNNSVLRRMAVRVDYERYFNNLNYSANIFTTRLVYRF
jgi:hypothetical protein